MLNLNKADRRFALRWILGTTIALGFCGALGPVGLFVGPILLAIAQGFALRRYWSRALQWGVATLVGGYVALGVFIALFTATGLTLPWLCFIVSGSVLGLVQAFVFKGRSRYWGWWPLLSGVSLMISATWFMGAATNAAVYGTQRSTLVWLGLAALTGLIGGALKGLALIGFLQQTPMPSRVGRDR